MPHQSSNLTVRREGPSVWDKQVAANSRCRAMSVIGFSLIAVGTCFVAQAYKARLVPMVKGRMQALLDRSQDDTVANASAESFPASDPPSWTPGVGKPASAGSPR